MKTDITSTVEWWKKAKIKAILLITIGMSIGIFMGIGFFVYTKSEPLYIVNNNKNSSIEIENNHRLNIFYSFHADRECPTNTTRYLWTYYQLGDEQIKVYLFLNNTSASVRSLTGDAKYIVSFELPEGIWSGQWNYFSITLDDCSFIKSLFRQQIIESYNFSFSIKNDIEKPDEDDIIKLLPPKL